MLHEFLTANHDELVKRCRAKVAKRSSPAPSEGEERRGEERRGEERRGEERRGEEEYGIPTLLVQLVNTLRSEGPTRAEPTDLPGDIGSTAGKHGNELLLKGFTIDQVVHDYGDLCQALTELAQERNAPISVDEFHTFNRCLDNAIADAVTEFGRQRDKGISEAGAHTMNERLGFLAHELRNHLNAAVLAFEAIKRGHAPVAGATGAVLGRSLTGLRSLIDRSLADVRLTEGLKPRPEPIAIHELVDDLRIWGAMEAKAKGLDFTIVPIAEELAVDADRQMISSAVANLLQNAIRFTSPDGHVRLTAQAAGDRVLIEVEDECGGLPEGRSEELFHSFKQRGDDRTGLGLGLSISRRGVEANGGTVSVRNMVGEGCVFTIDLPRRSHVP